MKYALYWQPNNEIEVEFFKTKEEAQAALLRLKARCEQTEADGEKMEYWDITLLKVIGDVIESPDGLKVLNYE